MLFGLGFEPNRVTVREQIVVGLFFGHDAAADGDNGAIAFAEDALESALLNSAIAGLAVEGKHFGEGHAGFLFDFMVELDERDVAVGSELGAECGLSGSAKTCERDAANAHILLRAKIAHEARGGFFEAMAGEVLDEPHERWFL